jgi:serine/threonine-protein kinase
MKRVKGTILQAVIAGLREEKPDLMERYPQRALLSVLERVCETVAYAHARGVVHRDLKPANVMLGDFGEVSVLDWGIAKLRTDSDLTGPTTEDSDEDFTVPGSVIGTPGYMAPEQATGDEIDARADVYALGAILYELLTGRPVVAVSRGTPEAYVAYLQSDQPLPSVPLAELAPSGLPEGIVAAVGECLAHDPARRPRDAAALKHRLAKIMEGVPPERPASLLGRFVEGVRGMVSRGDSPRNRFRR